MSVLFTRRGAPPDLKISVSISGSGKTTSCYVTINGTKYTAPADSIAVRSGDEITFGVYGTGSAAEGYVMINGATVLSVTDQTTKIYVWTVPSGISEISISMLYINETFRNHGEITVVTT